jgi:hypothetical protein
MIIYVYSETRRTNLGSRLGKPEYSYLFVREKFLPALRGIAQVVELADLGEARAEPGRRDVVLVFFGPPHRAPGNVAVPVICVFAWEFPTIPTGNWGDNEFDDWSVPLRRFGHAITLSSYATDAVRQALPELHVATIPAPIAAPRRWRVRFHALIGRGPASMRVRRFEINGQVHDSRRHRITHERVERMDRADVPRSPEWNGAGAEWSFRREEADTAPVLVGFYDADAWGAWSRISSPWIELPWRVAQPCRMSLVVRGIGTNVGRDLGVELGGDTQTMRLGAELETITLEFRPREGASALRFSGIDSSRVASTLDSRTLGIGIAAMRIEPGSGAVREAVAEATPPPSAPEQCVVDGVVFTSVFNPEDGRKNWEDLLTAFCWAFRDREDATLVLKMSHHNPATFYGRLMVLWSRLHPFRCRVVALHGYLDDRQFAQLIEASDFVVNSSYCEGQCLPLMEFMRAGVPAIAPDHTAMRDYLDASNAFVVGSSREPTSWPQDPFNACRTFRYRIDWDSLRRAYLEAYECAQHTPVAYRRLSRNAAWHIASRFGQGRVKRALRRFLHEVAGDG